MASEQGTQQRSQYPNRESAPSDRPSCPMGGAQSTSPPSGALVAADDEGPRAGPDAACFFCGVFEVLASRSDVATSGPWAPAL